MSLVSLQEKLLSKILMVPISNIENEHAGAKMIKKRLGNMRVLVVIDDVDQAAQLEYLAGNRNWFGQRSRIIITSFNAHLLNDVDNIYKAALLTHDEALQLLSLKAFNESHPPEIFLELSTDILGYAQGLPLAIVVIGSCLRGKSTSEWASAIDRLKSRPKREIIDVLQISFDGLEPEDKEIFLHIACFYKGKDRDHVIEILDYFQLNPVIGLSVLADRSLITVSNNKLSMHSLLQEMGREMVFRESPNDPGKRSRLWSPEDIHKTLKRNKGTEAVLGMVLHLPKLEKAPWNPESFSNMSELNLLQIRNVNLPKGLNCLSNSLKLLEWSGYPLRSLPQYSVPDELIEFSLCHSKIEQLWKGAKYFGKLKFIKLCHSHNIIQTPDLTGAYSLEKLDLEGCINLVRVHQSLGTLKKLIVLNLKSCESLESLPDIFEMESLETLILSGCSKIKKIPEFSGNMKCLSELYLDRTAIEDLPRSIEHLYGLSSLDLSNCKSLGCPPTTIIGQHEIGARAQENDGSESAVTDLSSSNILEHGVIQDSSSYLLTQAEWGYSFKLNGDMIHMKPQSNWLTRRWRDFRMNLLGVAGSLMLNMKPWSVRLHLCGLGNLTDLNISNCNLDDRVLYDFSWPPSLVALNLSGNHIDRLPLGIQSLLKHENINLENCKRLANLLNLPSSCKFDVRADGCSSLHVLFYVPYHARLETSYFSFMDCFGLPAPVNMEFIYRTLKRQVINRMETFQIAYPGSYMRIPRWFTFGRAIGSSVSTYTFTYTMGPLLYSSRLVGFALCAAFGIDEHHVVDELHTQYFKTFKATHHLVCYLKVGEIDLEVCGRQPAYRFSEEFGQVGNDHLWLFYVSSDKYFGVQEHDSCSEIEVVFETRGPGLEVKKCGLRMIFENDVQEWNNCTNCTAEYEFDRKRCGTHDFSR